MAANSGKEVLIFANLGDVEGMRIFGMMWVKDGSSLVNILLKYIPCEKPNKSNRKGDNDTCLKMQISRYLNKQNRW